jgi:predicted hotdog family 3-hydroxylacyl-ACP dehydratase
MSYPRPVEVLPHEPPMVLLDEVLFWEDKTARCRLRLREDTPLVDGGRVRSAAALEYMAQCVGVCTALRSLARNEPVRMGYLVGARVMSLEVDYFRVGDELVVEATEDYDGGELGFYACTVRRDGALVASATLSVYRIHESKDCAER